MNFIEELQQEKNNPVIAFIGSQLLDRSKKDKSIERIIMKANKSLKECYEYIKGEFFKRAFDDKGGKVAFGEDNEELIGMAIHYFDEDDIQIDKLPKGVREVSHIKEQRPQEKIELLQKKRTKKSKNHEVAGQISLF